MTIGDLVKYECPEEGEGIYRLGYITDVMAEDSGWDMYEVICTDPFDRGWYSDLALELVNSCKEKK